MSDNNGWSGKPGVPLNPEWDGWHWRRSSKVGSKPRATWWCASEKVWQDGPMTYVTVNIASQHYYLGPCLTPAEVEARVKEARRDATAQAARVVEAVKTWDDHYDYCESCKGGAVYPDSKEVAASIRALECEGDD